jgi:uncharacterized protein YutE (UPF0331/DUF86 family)
MDRKVIEQKLESLRRCIQRIRDKSPFDAHKLAQDYDLQDIVTLNLSRAVQLCVDIAAHCLADRQVKAPDTMGETFDTLAATHVIDPILAAKLKKAVGFRNIAVHNYEQIDWAIVHSITTRHLDDFKEFAQAITLSLDK